MPCSSQSTDTNSCTYLSQLWIAFHCLSADVSHQHIPLENTSRVAEISTGAKNADFTYSQRGQVFSKCSQAYARAERPGLQRVTPASSGEVITLPACHNCGCAGPYGECVRSMLHGENLPYLVVSSRVEVDPLHSSDGINKPNIPRCTSIKLPSRFLWWTREYDKCFAAAPRVQTACAPARAIPSSTLQKQKGWGW